MAIRDFTIVRTGSTFSVRSRSNGKIIAEVDSAEQARAVAAQAQRNIDMKVWLRSKQGQLRAGMRSSKGRRVLV